MCVKLISGNSNPVFTLHTAQTLIFMKWPSHQKCTMVFFKCLDINLKLQFEVWPPKNNFKWINWSSYYLLQTYVFKYYSPNILKKNHKDKIKYWCIDWKKIHSKAQLKSWINSTKKSIIYLIHVFTFSYEGRSTCVGSTPTWEGVYM